MCEWIRQIIVTDDISDMRPGMRAEIYLTAYKQRITPMVHGDIIQLSADRLTDSRIGIPYYAALVRIDQAELAAIPQIKLYPGIFKHSLDQAGHFPLPVRDTSLFPYRNLSRIVGVSSPQVLH